LHCRVGHTPGTEIQADLDNLWRQEKHSRPLFPARCLLIDKSHGARKNVVMNKPTNRIPPDVMADMQAVADAVVARRPVDPEVARRVRQRAQAITAEVRRKHGVLDIGVPAIRELRGELP
jgi:hypothetical protein